MIKEKKNLGKPRTTRRARTVQGPMKRKDQTTGTALQKRRDDDIFTQGYVCACANIILTHGADTIAKDVLRGAGKVDWKIIDEYDRDVLAKVGLAPLRRKSRKTPSLEQEGSEVR